MNKFYYEIECNNCWRNARREIKIQI